MPPRESGSEILKQAKRAFDEGHYTQVLNLLTSLDLSGLNNEKKVETLTMLGIAHFETGAHAEAMTHIKEALALKPHHARALDAYGDLLQEEGKIYPAITKYRAATKADPSVWEPYFHWGYLLKRMGSHKAALRKFEATLKRNPEHVEAYLHAGDCAFQLGFFKEALGFYEVAEKKGGLTSELSTRLGNVFLNLDLEEKAVEAYEQAIKLDPLESAGYENWGLVLHRQGDLEAAARKFEEGLLHSPQSPTLLLRHGEVLIASGQYKEALNPLEKAYKILLEKTEGEWAFHWSSILADCAYILGFAHRKLGNTEKARGFFLIALRYAPNHIDALGELSVLRGVYREHHMKWDFVLEGKVQTPRGPKTGLRAYRVAALTLDEALRYVKECEEEIQGSLKTKEVTQSDQVASYAGVLARGPLFLMGRETQK